MKYLNTMVTFSEFPDEIALCINITGCHFYCFGCHSPELWEESGTELTKEELSKLIKSNKGITCIGFMGGNPKEIQELAEFVKNNYEDLKVGWYWGGESFPSNLNVFDYIKLGPYIKELGGLDSMSTNQKFYKIHHLEGIIKWENITYKFWKHGNKNNN